ncbi:MAG: cytochrome c biogenesis protein CcdA [Candidatus Omnitrophica bacterium]|nr:cytochrome c biogenesis protein CcdA [Candidatus Omnitrophota bacterium]MDD5352887.1 cytochrome c biogenesis protein CcdA [Candidatus Omnitrophota bacterium]MDD5550486.1 cytochrome c biogenesis protein CcdA [Candidatus Omnitrophota bacterium]
MNLAGSPLDFLIAFFAGVLVSFTPCVYPLVPITVGYIGASASGSRLKGFLLSLIYALGVATTYSILGILASLTGKVFGQMAGNPWSYFILANVCIFFGLVLWDVFTIPMPVFNTTKIVPKSIFLVFLLGLVSGLIVGPCIVPVLATILIYVATKQNLLYGVFLLFCFAYGLCTVLILSGTFSSILVNLPKSGIWATRIKKFCGLILIGAGEYFLIQAGGYFI